MKRLYRIYIKLLLALIVGLVLAFAFDVLIFVNSHNSEFGYPLPFATIGLLFLGLFLFAWVGWSRNRLLEPFDVESGNKGKIDWVTALACIGQEMSVSDAKSILSDNTHVVLDDIRPYGKVFDFRWKGYQRFLPLTDFDLKEGRNWKLYISKNKNLAFMFVWDMSATPYCFTSEYLEYFFNTKPTHTD